MSRIFFLCRHSLTAGNDWVPLFGTSSAIFLLFLEKKSWLLEVFSHFFLGCFYAEISFILFIRFPFLGILGEVIILTEELESKEKKACRVLGLSYDELCTILQE